MSDVVGSRLRELLAKATPGPWYTLDPPWLTSGETSILAESPDPHVARFICDFDMWALDDEDDRKSENPDADAALIVAAVNALPGLLDEITRLRAQVASLTAAVEGERERCARFADELGDRLKATGHKAEAYGAYRVAAELDEVSAAVIRSGT